MLQLDFVQAQSAHLGQLNNVVFHVEGSPLFYSLSHYELRGHNDLSSFFLCRDSEVSRDERATGSILEVDIDKFVLFNNFIGQLFPA